MSNNCFKYAPKWMVSSLIFQKIFWGGAHGAPSPDPSPRFFLGFALGSGFALNSRALRALDAGSALDTRALRTLDLGFALNFRLGTLVWPPKINSWIRPWSSDSSQFPASIGLRNFARISVNFEFLNIIRYIRRCDIFSLHDWLHLPAQLTTRDHG